MGRILGVDYGDSRIGLALSDPMKIIASPYKTIPTKDYLDEIRSIIKLKKVERVIIGLPLGLKGQETIQTRKTRLFSESLNELNCPINFEDERLSSISAEKSLIQQNIKTGHNKSLIDQRAAAIILQQFLDKQCH